MKLAVKDIKPNPDNPRIIKDDKFKKLVQSLKDFPEMLEARPIILNKDHMILGGNMRLKAAIEAGYKEVDAEIFDWPIDKQREFIIKDNISGGEWDWDVLANEWDTELLDDWGLELPAGIEDFNDVKEDESPELDEGGAALSVPGTVYKLGRHRVMCGSSTSLDDMSTLMNDKKAAMVNTDPPYNVDYKGAAGKIQNDSFASNQEFYQFLYDAISAMRPFVVGDCYIAMSSSELHTLQKAFSDCGGHWSTFIIWVKNRFTLGRSNYHRQYEPILYGWFEGSSHHWSGNRKLGDVYKDEIQEDFLGRQMLYLDKIDTDIWEIDKPLKSKEHPTMKPIRLCARAIVNSSKKGSIVLDTFSGSGSTLIACEQTDRTCYGMELDPKYCDVIRKRYAKFVNNNELPENWAELTPIITEGTPKNG